MNWVKDDRYSNVYTCSEYFDKYKYTVEIMWEERSKSIRFWVGLSSGKKRKDLEIFEQKSNKSLGGIKSLIWAKKTMLQFPEFFKKNYRTEDIKLFICIMWSDNRRRKIYERLLKKDNFYFMSIDGKKTLIKEINNKL